MSRILLVATSLSILFVTLPQAHGQLSVKPLATLGDAANQDRDDDSFSKVWFAPNGRLVVLDGPRAINILDVKSGRRVSNIKLRPANDKTGIERYYQQLHVSYAGGPRIIVWNRRNQFHVYDLESGKGVYGHVRLLKDPRGAAISCDGKFAISANVNEIAVIDVDAQTELSRVKIQSKSQGGYYPKITCSQYSNAFAVTTGLRTTAFFELDPDGHPVHAGTIKRSGQTVIFSPQADKVLLASGLNSSLWDYRDQKQLHQWRGSEHAFFVDGGNAIADVHAGIVRVRDMNNGKELRSFRVLAGRSIVSAACSPDRQKLVVSYGRKVGVYDFETGKELRFIPASEPLAPVVAVSISDDGQHIVAADRTGVITIWSKSDGVWRPELLKDNYTAGVSYGTSVGPNFATFLPGTTRFISGSGINSTSANLCDAATGTVQQRFGPRAGGFAISKNGKLLAIATGHTLNTSGIEGIDKKPLASYPSNGYAVAISPDGSVTATAHILEIQGGRADNGGQEPSDFAPAISLIETATGRQIERILVPKSRSVHSVSISFDGRYLAAATNRGLYVYDMQNKFQERVFEVPQLSRFPNSSTAVFGCAFSPIDNIIAVPSSDGVIYFFDIEGVGDSPVATGQAHAAPVQSVSWQRNGQVLVSGSRDKTVRLWQVQR